MPYAEGVNDPWSWDEHGIESGFVGLVVDRRHEKGWSQTELAKQLAKAGLKFHQTTVARIEEGRRPLKLHEASAIAITLGIPLEWIVNPAGAGLKREVAMMNLWINLTNARTEVVNAVHSYGVARRELTRSLEQLESEGATATVGWYDSMRRDAPLRAIADWPKLRAETESAPRATPLDQAVLDAEA